ncbi:hypothetical protein HanXRQr2_Chr12g0537791 [Helianthus annuus]|uniref:Uncharacterized protein n=1 Tax=Helianthus annuus TaxID=4232 RepID=A0A9K3HG00_HELAN|nr:hypothetical protein HanXRQr2_Chr12g0537791 [Helianthus annuus]KAJ0862391.1 hypothetical protein HanPSC8_Chr12g0517651 [Helianthus annuus]
MTAIDPTLSQSKYSVDQNCDQTYFSLYNCQQEFQPTITCILSSFLTCDNKISRHHLLSSLSFSSKNNNKWNQMPGCRRSVVNFDSSWKVGTNNGVFVPSSLHHMILLGK